MYLFCLKCLIKLLFLDADLHIICIMYISILFILHLLSTHHKNNNKINP